MGRRRRGPGSRRPGAPGPRIGARGGGRSALACAPTPRLRRRRSPSRNRPIPIFGNTQGLKASQTRQLERLCRRRLPPERLVTQELARQLCAFTHETGRQVGVLVDRRGDVTHVMVGDARGIEMPDWGRIRAGRGRLRGFRCIVSHVGNDPLSRDNETDLAVLRLDAMVAITTGEDGLPGVAHWAALRPANRDGSGIEFFGPTPPALVDFDFRDWIRAREEELARQDRTRKVGDAERAILVSVTAGRKPLDLDVQIEELKELARSAGVEVVDVVTQHRGKLDRKFLMGPGRLQDLVIQAFQSDVDLVIFDQDLTPTQARNLGERLELRVIDRTQLILDIFAQHARTRDGKLQVELAQLRYLTPRLAQRADVSLSRLAGGIGGRGPGETKLEVDRRRVRDRIARLERELKQLRGQRESRRRRRTRRDVPILSIVGYTNAGKSTLLRAITKTDVHVEDKMFATLDPTSRRLRFPEDREVIVTDTVGFIRDLPKDLVAAFQATLEELSEADLLLHVVDASAEDYERRIEAVHEVLREIGSGDTPELLVFNQIDKLPPGVGPAIAARHGGVAISATARTGLAELIERAQALLFKERQVPDLVAEAVGSGGAS